MFEYYGDIHVYCPGVGAYEPLGSFFSEPLIFSPTAHFLQDLHIVVLEPSMLHAKSCADPEIFMRGGPTKMVIFGHRRGGVQPPKNPEITFF